ncbi:double-strand break repair helicase AddA [Xanthobacter pseudotagetidis]|uniref:double-strand break repair helicase AddA n=1 Tax=Xanthobacter pseudotagetidis TaxID=3119911 RepID=UPI003729F516
MSAPPPGSEAQDGARGPLAEATRRQELASRPAHSAWVSANAGSGKTHVLARRVIRLLLAGTPPGRILCLTYTKAAAANMANRVLKILGEWVRLDDAGLDAAIAAAHGGPVTAALRARARRLFAAALETPGGLKIQTIHAFCGALLHRFPFEAEVAAGFRELDDAGRAEIMGRLRADLVMEAAADPEGPLGRALFRLMAEMSDASLTAMLEAAVAHRAGIEALGPTEASRRAGLAAALGLPAGTSSEGVRAAMLESPHLPRGAWRGAAGAIDAAGSANDRKRAATLLAAAEAETDAEALAAYLDVFFTDKGEPRAALLTKAAAAAEPDLARQLADEQARLAALQEELRGALALERTLSAHALGARICARYQAEKAARGLLDFDDLIQKASGLLNAVPASFVHFKLDQGIDHILVDEAQDTSPAQWKVVEGLTSDFFSGAGAREDVTRTVFVVGDEKQSIFSFQGAEPAAFGGMRSTFERKAGSERFARVELPHSFRSAPGVLEAVDAVFRSEAAHRGLTLENVAPAHAPIRAGAPALMEVWPTTTPAPRPEVDDWRRPLDQVPADDPVNALAVRIARFVQAAVAAGVGVPSRGGRPLKAGDVLILVRRRGKIFEAVIRALKELGDPRVAVAGADRLVVAQHIAAMDLMALADALLSPEDDLALATVLKSPLFGFTDDDLMAWCPGRQGRLMDALTARAGGDPRLTAALERLARWRGEALTLRPFDFYAGVLGRDGGRRAFLARLGPEAADAISEFMTLARTYEQWEAASLPGFLAFLRRGGAEVKRDMEGARDEVRVMTVHGAKGLEAPLVILADTVDMPKPRTEGGFLKLPAGGGAPIPILAPRKAEDTPVLDSARTRALGRDQEELHRLLYVALTRAEDALVVCGAETRQPAKGKAHARPEGCWYDLVRDALVDEAEEVQALGFEGTVLRWRRGPGLGRADAAEGPAEAPAPQALPRFGPPPPEAAPRPLRPSRTAARPALQGPGKERESPALSALVRGDLVHRLLAALPAVADAVREQAGLRFLAHAAPRLSRDDDHAEILDEALVVLRHAPLADLFGGDGLPEVPVVGVLTAADGTRLSVNGRIDRLVPAPGRVLLADFKTDRNPPESLAAVEPAYIAQLAAYAAVLGRAMPGQTIAARLVYTAGPVVIEVPQAVLDAALSRLLGLTSA